MPLTTLTELDDVLDQCILTPEVRAVAQARANRIGVRDERDELITSFIDLARVEARERCNERLKASRAIDDAEVLSHLLDAITHRIDDQREFDALVTSEILAADSVYGDLGGAVGDALKVFAYNTRTRGPRQRQPMPERVGRGLRTDEVFGRMRKRRRGAAADARRQQRRRDAPAVDADARTVKDTRGAGRVSDVNTVPDRTTNTDKQPAEIGEALSEACAQAIARGGRPHKLTDWDLRAVYEEIARHYWNGCRNPYGEDKPQLPWEWMDLYINAHSSWTPFFLSVVAVQAPGRLNQVTNTADARRKFSSRHHTNFLKWLENAQ